VSELKQFVKIPIAVKLSPFFASFANVAHELEQAGADGLVMFNRFYQPDIDIVTMEPASEVRLSTSHELLLRLRWLAILYGRIRPSLIATGGVATPEDGIKALLAGANAVQVVSAILRQGPAYFTTLRVGLERWMEGHGIEDIDRVRGRTSLIDVVDPSAFERAHYIKALNKLKAAAETT
jgi:dihydroorotate dehydrogenase (fumarate)